MTVCVTADIVGSRLLADRAAAQRDIESAIARVDEEGPTAVRPLRPTVGDEFQGVYDTLEGAMAAVLLLRLAFPDGVDCRFGLGIGETGTIPSAVTGGIPEGPGWWAARTAIETIHAVQDRTVMGARTWVCVADDGSEDEQRAAHIANAGLLVRDHLVTAMTGRARRLAYGRCAGRTQSALAAAEGISQSAVSQLLASSGATAVVEGYRVLRGG
ncbi:SatD family protein [Microbacterium caowuchunii]|uniref:SatD family (SatD) n=1 Tax=Microbacterium caowuchunii TaxID=2614638 RepID=A0A5N0T4Z2_9MICO|nr:SatD family protein [Microbacterium caowuchunii]KAA9129901.1 hypothetical protein F6B40_14485 [Microbacterium caowuchunii]